MQLLPDLQPVILTSLDEFDPRIRLQASRALRSLFFITPATFDGMTLPPCSNTHSFLLCHVIKPH